MTNSINQTSQFHKIMLNWTKSQIRVVPRPRKFNFPQLNKLIKLNHQDQFNNISQQKPNDQFWKKRLKSIKTLIFLRFEIFPKRIKKKCMKHENKWKRKGKKVLLALEVKSPWRNLKENDKKFLWTLTDWRERERTFWKSLNNDKHVKNLCF